MLTNAITLGNKNVDFVHDKHIGLFYFLAIVILRLLVYLLPIDGDTQWSLLHWIHTIFTFITFHHSKGSPDDDLMGQGKYGYLTWREQIDNGKQFTFEKNMLTIAPIVLFLLVCRTTAWDSKHLIINFIGLMLVLITKFPGMHRLRPFGWNEGYY
eukprot:EC723801.1.p1 GENE.EC723801.1~~EC723801.1.p1  ORF type:complete len:155 (+),score=35.32 EC723801.1:39-503(+)